MIGTNSLPVFRAGDELSARDLNRVLTVLAQCERALEHVPLPSATVRRGFYKDSFRERPWEVQLGADERGYVVRVRAASVVLRWGAQAVTGRPFPLDEGKVWVYVRVPKGLEVFDVWLVCRGEVSPDGCYPQQVTVGELTWELLVLAPGKVPYGSPLRVWLLASVDVLHACAVTQHVWGELDLCEVRGVLAADGHPLLPADKLLPSQFKSAEGYKVLTPMQAEGECVRVATELRGALDRDGFLRLLAGEAGSLWPEDDPPFPVPPAPPEPPPVEPDDPDDPDPDDPDPDNPDPDEPDDPDTPPVGPVQPQPDIELPDGVWFSGGDGVTVTAHRTADRSTLAYRFSVRPWRRLEVPLEANVVVTLPVSVNPDGEATYDWPEWNLSDLTMHYGVTAALGGGVEVLWRSSHSQSVGDLVTSCSVSPFMRVKVSTHVLLSGKDECDSEGLPEWSCIKVKPLGSVVTREVNVRVRENDKIVTRRMRRSFRKYLLSVDDKGLKGAAAWSVQRSWKSVEFEVSPESITGESTMGLTPPTVTAGEPTSQVINWSLPRGVTAADSTGGFKVTVAAEIGEGACEVPVEGGSQWNWGEGVGSISGKFKIKAKVKDAQDGGSGGSPV